MSNEFKDRKDIQQPVKKSRKKLIIAVSILIIIIAVGIPVIIYTYPATTDPLNLVKKFKPTDFPLEKFSQGYDILCLRDKHIACLVKNDGRILLKLENGVYIFQTVDYSLMKGFSNDLGHEENSISYAFYEHQVDILDVKYGGQNFWLETPNGMQ